MIIKWKGSDIDISSDVGKNEIINTLKGHMDAKGRPKKTEDLLREYNKSTKAIDSDTTLTGVSISVKPSGCNGYSYDIKPWVQIDEDEAHYEDKNVKVRVMTGSEPFLHGCELDYVVSPDGFTARFDIINPLEVGRCGCGESFNLDNPKI